MNYKKLLEILVVSNDVFDGSYYFCNCIYLFEISFRWSHTTLNRVKSMSKTYLSPVLALVNVLGISIFSWIIREEKIVTGK